MQLSNDRQVNEKSFKIGMNSQNSARFDPLLGEDREIVKKIRRLRNCGKSCPIGIHHHAPPATQWMTTDSALQSCVTDLYTQFTRLPCLTLRPLLPSRVRPMSWRGCC